jgi:hypothetical protein
LLLAAPDDIDLVLGRIERVMYLLGYDPGIVVDQEQVRRRHNPLLSSGSWQENQPRAQVMREPLPNIETLQDDGELFVFRTVRDGEPLLVVRPAGTEVAGAIAQFENALGLRDQLDPAWAVRPRTLDQHHGKPALLLDDARGELLSRQVLGPRDLVALLRVAVGAAAALRELHARGIVHRDIRTSTPRGWNAPPAESVGGHGRCNEMPQDLAQAREACR